MIRFLSSCNVTTHNRKDSSGFQSHRSHGTASGEQTEKVGTLGTWPQTNAPRQHPKTKPLVHPQVSACVPQSTCFGQTCHPPALLCNPSTLTRHVLVGFREQLHKATSQGCIGVGKEAGRQTLLASKDRGKGVVGGQRQRRLKVTRVTRAPVAPAPANGPSPSLLLPPSPRLAPRLPT